MDSIIVDEKTSCIGRRINCEAGSVDLVICEEPRDVLRTSLVKKEKFQNIATGSLLSAYEDDWSRAYFMYIDAARGAIYLEGELDAFDDPLCAATALPIVLEQVRRIASPEARAMLEQIMSRRVFRYLGY